MAFEAYRIAVRLSLIENVTAGLTRLSANFARAGMDANALQKRLDKIAKTTLVGTALTATGGFLLKSLQAPLEEAKKFQTEQAKFAALGLGEKALDDATKFAKGMHIIGSSARDNLKLLREATTITGDYEHAEAIAPRLAKMRFGIQSVMGDEHARSFDSQFAAAIKVAELRGALVNRQTGQIDTASFDRVLNLMTKAYVASGGLVKPSDYLAAIKTGGVSAKLMNDESFFFALGHFMQESGGSRTGTAMMSQFQNWVMGRMPQRVAEDMAKIGLLNKSAIHYGKTGHITRVDVEGLLRAKEFVDSPFKYMNDVVVPLLQKQGFKGNELNLKLASLFGIRTASNLADQMVREAKVADLYINRSNKAADVDTLYNLGANTMQGKEIDLHAKWADLMRETGETILPFAIAALEKLNSGLKGLTELAKQHPNITKATVESVALVGALATLGGTLALLKAGFMALSPLLGVGTGITGLIGKLLPLLGVGPGLAGMLVGVSGAILSGAGIGVALGYLIYKLNEGSESMFDFGRMVAKVWAFFGSKDAQEALDAEDHVRRATKGVRMQLPAGIIPSAAGAGRGLINPPTKLPSVVRQAVPGETDKPASGRFGNVVPPGGKSHPVQVTSVVKLNEREIARAVTEHQTKEAQKPQSGTSWFSGGRMPAPVNFSY